MRSVIIQVPVILYGDHRELLSDLCVSIAAPVPDDNEPSQSSRTRYSMVRYGVTADIFLPPSPGISFNSSRVFIF